ncbi:MAG: hypothetical protein NPINA01_01260 [Nitrospinaceae bacterium]|nr:MAG: hypothetical protein NPINA01_01260 [Nitrospinaceae bacterium]
MAQVSDAAASPLNSLGPLQAEGAGQKNKPARDAGEGVEDEKNNGVETKDPGKNTRDVRPNEDQVRLSREARDQNRESRADEGSRNENNLRPQRERIDNERGAAQKFRDLEDTNARGVRGLDEAAPPVESENPGNNRTQEIGEARAQIREAEEPRTNLEQHAADSKNAEVQLREFQTKDEIRVEPKIVSEAVEEIEGQRAKAEAAKEPALEPPSQRIDPNDPALQSERSAAIKEQNDPEGSRKDPPNPVSVQTETGQNVDDLI